MSGSWSCAYLYQMQAGLRYPFNTKEIQLPNSGRISYIDEGKGEQTIVFIHGLANYALAWQKNISELSRKYRCIALDLPGNGLSGRGPFPFGIAWFAQALAEFLDALNLSRVSLAGHSMGGQIAMTAVLGYPHLAEKLILCAPAGFEAFTPFERSLYRGAAFFLDLLGPEESSLRTMIRNSFHRNKEQAEPMIQDLLELMQLETLSSYKKMVEACVHGMLNEPVYDRLHLINCPTLVIFGTRDALIPNRFIHPVSTSEIARQGTARIPNARLELFENCGHFVHWEKAERVNQLIDSFLQDDTINED